MEGTRAQVEVAQATSRSSAAQVTQRQVQLQFNVVRAPFAGTVGDVLARVGDFVSASTPLTSVAQADVLEVSVAVPSQRARSMKPDTALEILDAQGKVVLTTSVFFVAPQVDPRTQLVEVKAAFRNTVGLRPSELVRARLVYSVRDALQIPALAVVRQSGQHFALVVQEKDGKTAVERRPITLGALGDGLRGGEGAGGGRPRGRVVHADAARRHGREGEGHAARQVPREHACVGRHRRRLPCRWQPLSQGDRDHHVRRLLHPQARLRHRLLHPAGVEE
jgi:multidrug efflux pump subunit AcrA (membrane-fusion protein)